MRARGQEREKGLKLKPPSPSELGDRIRETEVWKSIFRPGSIFRKGYKDTSRDRALATMNNVLYHLHPVKVKRHAVHLAGTQDYASSRQLAPWGEAAIRHG